MKKLIGIPWKYGGYNFNGCDCFGLALLAQGELYGRKTPFKKEWFEYSPDLFKEHCRETFKDFSNHLIFLPGPEPGCILGFRLGGYVHAATFLGGDKILHIFENRTSRIAKLTPTLRRCLFASAFVKGGEGEWV